MEEAKAAAYYDELARKGEGAARFKRGLGFSSTNSTKDGSDFPARGSALPSSSSFLSSFVKASSPAKTAEFERQAQLEIIQSKLKKKPSSSTSEIQHSSSRVSRDIRQSSSKDGERDLHSRRRSRSRSREGRGSRHRHRSSSRDRNRDRYGETERDKVRDRRRRRRRSRSRSVSDDDRHRRRDRGRNGSGSPRDWTPERSGGDRGKHRAAGKVGRERNGAIDYAKLIEGYDKMVDLTEFFWFQILFCNFLFIFCSLKMVLGITVDIEKNLNCLQFWRVHHWDDPFLRPCYNYV